MNSYDYNIVNKPWGYEYLVYQNEDIALWFLYINKFQSTSLHCHPKKTTGLILLDGEVEVSFFNDKKKLTSLDKVMIRQGLFHSTKSVSINGSFLLEVETPVDKQDLVRFKDDYGREGKPYEDITHEIPKKDECLWIQDPITEDEVVYNFCNTILIIKSVIDCSYLQNIDDGLNVMFLRGGLQTNYGQIVAGSGTIIDSRTLKKLMTIFTDVIDKTIIMILKK